MYDEKRHNYIQYQIFHFQMANLSNHIYKKKLYQILINQESRKSLTIGLVGPWGNGKSSIIQMLLDKFEPNLSYKERFNQIFNKDLLDDYLIIHFLPYLNHQEEDLIKEFFRALSSKLKPYNGKLSNLVLEYSKQEDRKLLRSICFDMVVDSPPGITIASQFSIS